MDYYSRDTCLQLKKRNTPFQSTTRSQKTIYVFHFYNRLVTIIKANGYINKNGSERK